RASASESLLSPPCKLRRRGRFGGSRHHFVTSLAAVHQLASLHNTHQFPALLPGPRAAFDDLDRVPLVRLVLFVVDVADCAAAYELPVLGMAVQSARLNPARLVALVAGDDPRQCRPHLTFSSRVAASLSGVSFRFRHFALTLNRL